MSPAKKLTWLIACAFVALVVSDPARTTAVRLLGPAPALAPQQVVKPNL